MWINKGIYINKHEKSLSKRQILPQKLRETRITAIFQNEMIRKETGMAKKRSLQEQADEIIRIAEDSGVQSNYFFVTTFKRYQVQLGILNELEKVMEEEGMLVTKEYVKNRKNLYSNPAVAEYNRTTDSANKTVSTLLKIIKNFGVDEDNQDTDPLMEMIRGE